MRSRKCLLLLLERQCFYIKARDMRTDLLLEQEYEWLQQSLNWLTDDEKAIIERRYLANDVYDYIIWPELNLTERTYG